MAATQFDRPFRVKTTLGEDVLLLESFTGYERLSSPFRFVLQLLADDPNIDMKALLNKPMVLSMKLEDETERSIHGMISRLKMMECGKDGKIEYQAEMIPWTGFLNTYIDCKIFQNKSVPDIVQKIFTDRGYTDFNNKLEGTYEPREYCVQYRETDFNFISRLMEEEGISYFFEQTADKHTMVLADTASAYVTNTHKPKFTYQSSSGGASEEEMILSLVEEHRVNTGKVSLVDYDFEKPKSSLYASLTGASEGQADQLGEVYDYPGNYKTKSEGDHYVRLRLEEQEVGLVTVRGHSNCRALECGYKFTLEGHYRDAANAEYIVTSLQHNGRNPSYRSNDSPDPFDYWNEFEAIPSTVNYRPPLLSRKPIIPGTQTAVVVGKPGEEIWTDKYGRVKVQFFWDRVGTADDNSSCWIRVATSWAGKQWGAIHIPRIGQEVVVNFLEGDPDRPIIVGSVYNADQEVPYALPAEQTKSTLKSMSSKGGDGFNEFRLEDKKGSEQIFIHGEKDLDIRIKNDRNENIDNNHSLTVKQDKMEKVGRDSHVDITQDFIEQIGRDLNVTVKGKAATKITGSNSLGVTGDLIEEITGNHSSQVTQNLYLKALQVVIEASTGLTLKMGPNFITIDPSGIAISGMPMVQINSGGSALSGSAGSLVSPLSPTAPKDADTADPGAVTAAPTGNPQAAVAGSASDIQAAMGAGKKTAASSAPTHNPNAPENADKKHYIEIELLDKDSNPIPGEVYKITLPDGTTVASGTLDSKGFARVDNIDPGNCIVTFPNMDKDSWEPK